MENEWQPVRIAPMKDWHKWPIQRYMEDARQAVGKIVLVRPSTYTAPGVCSCKWIEIHPDSLPITKGDTKYPFLPECCIQAD